MNKALTVSVILILFSFILGIYFYGIMPDKIASHWNANGNADGYLSKFWGLFLLPIISLGLFLLLLFIPRIDPKKENIKKFEKSYFNLILITVIFMLYIYLLSILYNLNYNLNMTQWIIPGFSLLFFYIGIVLGKAKQNFTIGIRTSWTLSSEEIWDKTHKMSANLFKFSAIISLLGIFLPKYAIIFIIIPLIISALYSIIYSYILFRRKKSR